MVNLIFKRLFEVRFLHEFFLADREADGALFFSKTPAVRKIFLEKFILRGGQDIRTELEFEPTPDTARRLRGLQWKFGTTATGFIVGAPVVEQEIDNAPALVPKTAPKLGERFSFFVRLKNPQFRSYTALRMRQPDGVIPYYYMSNRGKTLAAAATSPLSEPMPLSEAVADFQIEKIYEPGELAFFNGKIYEAVGNTQNSPNDAPQKWLEAKVTAQQGYLNESDRRLVASQFVWNWTGSVPAKLEFLLKKNETDDDALALKIIQASVSDRSRRVPLNFFSQHKNLDGTPGNLIAEGNYFLKIKRDGVDELTRPFFILPEISGGSPAANSPLLGIVSIEHLEKNEGIHFLDEKGRILSSTPAAGTGETAHPVFEVRLLSRGAWWRYRSDRAQVLKTTPTSAPVLSKLGDDLMTKKPMRFFSFAQVFSAGGSSTPIHLPNPPPTSLQPSPDGRLVAQLLVSKLTDLIDIE